LVVSVAFFASQRWSQLFAGSASLVVSGERNPSSASNCVSASSAIAFFHSLLGLNGFYAFHGKIGRDASFRAILVDLALDHFFDLAEVGGHVDIESYCASAATSASAALIFSSASYFWIILAYLAQLLGRVLNFLEAVAIGFLVNRKLSLVRSQIFLWPFEVQARTSLRHRARRP